VTNLSAALRDAEQASITEGKRRLMPKLVTALRSAETLMLELQRLENAEAAVIQMLGPVDRFALASLGENDSGERALDHWVERARTAGLLD
jgi:hypothetical protein